MRQAAPRIIPIVAGDRLPRRLSKTFRTKQILAAVLTGLTIAAPARAYGPSNPLVCKQGEQKALVAYSRVNTPLIDNVYICDAPQALRTEAGLQALKDAIGGTALPGSSIKIVSIILLDN